MARSRWLCTNSSKNMLVKIVHPGGHVELHDRPVLAAEIMLRNPRCCVAYPHVFQQPWAIVAPDTTLVLGQKFYVVPLSTVRKLQRLSLKYSPSASPSSTSPSPSPVYNFATEETPKNEGGEHEIVCTCWFFLNKGTYACVKQEEEEEEEEGQNMGSRSSPRKRIQRENDGKECFSKDNCFVALLAGMRAKTDSGNLSEESRSIGTYQGTSETRELVRQNRSRYASRRGTRGSIRRLMSLQHWQPRLGSINEE
ncbi:hypothetical protein CDL15_Pgr014048 [Punica granatum]|uniref:Uncharacterized protein n=1 Tax=Punica granatum TaxID=22663 RepID=A0A218W9N6_PUNGR|nr:hypothetical protein CDL15_Pgr014048 [Punica granatum]PKI31563.1 hypothetical protein CRG98_048047 [Punica granatum]